MRPEDLNPGQFERLVKAAREPHPRDVNIGIMTRAEYLAHLATRYRDPPTTGGHDD